MKRKAEQDKEWEGGPLPKDLTKLTAEQRQVVVDFQSTWPLVRLRKFQAVVHAQERLAFERGMAEELASLDVSANLCALAIMKREFGG